MTEARTSHAGKAQPAPRSANPARLHGLEMLISAALLIWALYIAFNLHQQLQQIDHSKTSDALQQQRTLVAFRERLSELSAALSSPRQVRALLPPSRDAAKQAQIGAALHGNTLQLLDNIQSWLDDGADQTDRAPLREALNVLQRSSRRLLDIVHDDALHGLGRLAHKLNQLASGGTLYLASLLALTLALLFSLLYASRLRRRLRYEQQRFNDSISDLSEGFALFDAHDRLVQFNPAFRELLPNAEKRELQGASYKSLSRQIYSQDDCNDRELQTRLIRRQAAAEPIEISDARGRHFAVRERRTRDGGTVCLYLDITEMQRAQRHLRHLASHDVLTGLPNRSHFHTQLNRALQDARQRGRKVAVLFFDLDNFKHINDSAGHQCGDLLLKAVARDMRQMFQHSDQLARLGGDEFAAMLPAISSRVPVAELAAQLLDKLREGYLLDESRICVNASIGIALYPEDGDDFNNLLDNADAACLRAKAMGKNGFQFYHAEMNLRSARRRRIEHQLKEALEHNELSLCYQPQLAVQSELMAGMEALVRWHHPELGQVSPGEFIPVAEDSGLIIALGDWVLEQALRDFHKLDNFGIAPGTLSVNLSRRQFLSPNVVERVEELLAQNDVDPHRLVLEITETAVLEDFQKARVVIHQLHEMGVGIALDDFGAGYSSFDALRHFPLDEIKIDQSFIFDMTSNPRSLAIVRAMIAIARALRTTVVAEGIENAEQFALLRKLGCERGQGFYLGEPMPVSAIAGFCNSGLQISY